MREHSKRTFASREYWKTTDWPQCSKKHRLAEYYGKLPTTSQNIVAFTTGGHVECVLWEFRQPNTHSEPINKPLVDEITDFTDFIYRHNNYVENLLVMGNNENKIIIFIQQFYIAKHDFSKNFSQLLFMKTLCSSTLSPRSYWAQIF